MFSEMFSSIDEYVLTTLLEILKNNFPCLYSPPCFYCHYGAFRSSHRRCHIKKCAEEFHKSIRQHLWRSLFYKVAGLQACNFIIKRRQHRCFPMNFAKFLRTPILKNISEKLLLSLGK